MYIYIFFLYISCILFHSHSLFLTRSIQLILAHTHSTALVTLAHSYTRTFIYTKLYICVYIYIYVSRYMVSIRSNSQCVFSPLADNSPCFRRRVRHGASDGEHLPISRRRDLSRKVKLILSPDVSLASSRLRFTVFTRRREEG